MRGFFGFVSTLQILNLFSSSSALQRQPRHDSTFAAVKEQTFDYIIVGGGLTGLVVANRLSEQKKKTVLVIENGIIDDSPPTSIPYLASVLNTGDMWPAVNSAPDPNLNNLSYPVRVGNVVGGGTIVNGMAWCRGSNADYDAWEQLGNPGWSWKDLEPYFKKTSRFTPPSESSRLKFNLTYDVSAYGSGLAQVSIPSFQYDDYIPIFNSYRAENIPMPVEGFNDPVGAFWLPNDIDNATATRSHARKTYYDPVQTRSNLVLLTSTQVKKVLVESRAGNKGSGKLVAKGVQIFSRNDSTLANIYARQEVILAAGGVFTPHLLLLSGIGPKDVLDAANITVKLDNPSVGSNFQDHPYLAMNFNLSNEAVPNPNTPANNATFSSAALALYDKDRSGPYSAGRGNAVAFLAFKHFSTDYKNITASISAQNPTDFLPARYAKDKTLLAGYKRQLHIITNLYLGDKSAIGESPIQPWGRSTVAVQKPLSRGTITLNTTDPEAPPIITYNTFQNPVDRQVQCELVAWNRAHWKRKEVARFAPIEVAPGVEFQTCDEILHESARTGSLNPSFAHPSGGCSMMPKELGGCVGTDLLVYGVENLSVVDASIIPLIPATHLQATMYGVSEKASDIIKQRT